YQTLHGLSAADALAVADVDHDGHITNADVQAGIVAIANASPPAPYGRGDVNGDTAVNVADVSSLMTGLSDLPKYETTHGLIPSQFLGIADLNSDGHVDNRDVQGLIVAIANSGAGGAAPAAASTRLPPSAASATPPATLQASTTTALVRSPAK